MLFHFYFYFGGGSKCLFFLFFKQHLFFAVPLLTVPLAVPVTLYPGQAHFHVYVCALTLYCFHSLSQLSHQRVLTASADSCTEMKSTLSVHKELWPSMEEGAGK